MDLFSKSPDIHNSVSGHVETVGIHCVDGFLFEENGDVLLL